MKNSTSTPTLVVFTLGGAEDSTRRPLLPGHLRELEVDFRDRCLDAALEAGRRLGCRLVVSTPGELELAPDVERISQAGGSFGSRLKDTIQRASAATDGPLLVVGADSPGLTEGHLRLALERLEDHPGRVVLGPCPDGGFYLLAIDHAVDQELDAVRWCDRRTLETLVTSLEEAGRAFSFLPDLGDLDHRGDLEAWLALRSPLSSPWRPLVHALRRALAALCRPLTDPALIWPQAAFVPIPATRAPPCRNRFSA